MILYPATIKSADIQCSVEIVSLRSKKLHYEALSYAWGDPRKQRKIFVDSKALWITHNLDVALRHLRYRDGWRVLWIDDICINQSNNMEKNHQVRQMFDTFSTATIVLVWLGPMDEKIEQGLDFLYDTRENRDKREKPVTDLLKIYKRPWWSRMWVIQEVIRAKAIDMICGDIHLPWEAVLTTLVQISHAQMDGRIDISLADPQALTYFGLMITFLGPRSEREGPNLKFLLQASCGREASDPRDYVYALLGAIVDPQHEPFEPDYTQSVSWAYQKATVSVCKSFGDLELLLAAFVGNPTLKPSWCVDFSSKYWSSAQAILGWGQELFGPGSLGQKDSAFAGKERMRLVHDSKSGTISVVGTEIGRIEKTVDSTCGPFGAGYRADDSGLMQLGFEDFKEWGLQNLHRNVNSFVVDAQEALERRLGSNIASKKLAEGDIWMVTAAGYSFDDLFKVDENTKPIPHGYALLEKHALERDSARRILSYKWSDLASREPSLDIKTLEDALWCLTTRLRASCLFTTDTGYIGLAREHIQNEDVLVLLFGCKLPLILRPQGDGSYILVTSTYTDGVVVDHAVTEVFVANVSSAEEKEFILR